MVVDHLDGRVERSLPTDRARLRGDVGHGVRTVISRNPDGNEVGLGGAPLE
jgi:hypothetical protein